MKLSKIAARKLHKHRYIFKRLSAVDKKTRSIILAKSPVSLYDCIKTLCKGLVDGGIVLTNHHRNRLATHRSLIRELSKGTNRDIKSKSLMNGDGLGSFLKSVLPIITPILAALI